MAPERDFLQIERQDVSYRPVAERIKDFAVVDLPLTDTEIRVQAARCMNCGTPFCHASPTGCPLGNIIPEFNEHVYHGRWTEAGDILLQTNCFPEFTGRVCPAPCEGACVLELVRRPAVNICKIELAVAEEGFRSGHIAPRPPRTRRNHSVAVVGSGPAGLAVAHVLNHMGVVVTVYEKDVKPGGLLRYGIPDFKLEKRVVDRRTELMQREGVVFECRVDVGEDVSYGYLRHHFDAVVLATGAGVPRDIVVPGRRLEGIHFAMDFLAQQNRVVSGELPEVATAAPMVAAPHADAASGAHDRITAAGKRVVVIGGGDTGSDCIGTAWRQGARDVTQLEILPEPPASRADCTPWPQWPLMRRDSSSHKEGGSRRWGVDTIWFSGEGGRVQRVHCVEVEWVADEAGGPRRPRAMPGTEFTLEADLVLIATGFVGPGRTAIVEELGLEKDERGFLCRDAQCMSSRAGIFVAGDMQRGPSLVVHAIADGMQTARQVITYLGEGG